MHAVADASILVEALKPNGSDARRWLVALLDGDPIHIVHGLTILEVSSALRSLNRRDASNESWTSAVHERLVELPATRENVTQAMARRIWELRGNHTPYDAAYLALTEALQAETGGSCVLATADQKLANSPQVVCPVHVYAPEAN